MEPRILTQDLSQEFDTPEKCYITELSNAESDPEASIARARVEPGVTTRLHRLLRASERYCIISGIGRVEIGSLPAQEVNLGDVIPSERSTALDGGVGGLANDVMKMLRGDTITRADDADIFSGEKISFFNV